MKIRRRLLVTFLVFATLCFAVIGSFHVGQATTHPQPSGIDEPAAPSIVVTKTVGVDPLACALTSEIQVSPGDSLFYCITIQNTGSVSFTVHQVSDSILGGPVPLSYLLNVGDLVPVNNAVLASLGLPTVLGPIPAPPGILTNTVTVVSSNPGIEGAVATASATAIVSAVPTGISEIEEPVGPRLVLYLPVVRY